ncbi:Ig-like domain-containing protein [Paludisphaera soli]|uniref:Ig-like domain-containing protein n=1 Tax=Paludisphaera soli TaxID=2712865 RepID=UPI0013EB6554|nr:Ig-like domain-containing protein [Paludisphaera soli]
MTGMDAKGPGSLPAGSDGRRAREIERRKRRQRPSLDGLEARVAPASGFAAGLPVAARYAVSESFGSRDASYAATDDGGAIVLANAANAYDATVGPGGFRIVSGADSWSLSVRGLGYGEDVRPLGAATVSTDTNRVEYDHGAVTQWYVNGPLGLQQGFTLDARPEGSDLGGPLTIVLGVDGLVVAPEPGGTSVALVRGDGSTAASYGGLIAYDAAGRSVPATMSVDSGGSIAIRVDDAGAAYPLVVDPFVARARLPVDSSEFAMSADGRTLAVGQEFFGEVGDLFWAGAVFIYERAGETWVETARIQPDLPIAQSGFGHSTALSGDGSTLFVGADRARLDTSERGVVYVFARTDDGWDQVQVIEPGPDGRGYFGATLATNADGGVVAIPDFPHAQEPAGGPSVVWIYAKDGPTWAVEAGFGSPPGPAFSGLGPPMEFDDAGTTLLVGASSASNSGGEAYLFTKEASGWMRSLLTDLDPSLAGSTRRLGEGVALSGDGSTMLVASAPTSETNAYTRFAIRTYRRTGAGWDFTGDLPFPTGLGEAVGDGTVAVNADGTMAVALARATGYAYVFRKEAGAWTHLSTFWTGDAYRFGLAFAGDLLAVGAYVGYPTDPAAGGLRLYSYEPGFEVTGQPADVVAIPGRPATFTAEAGAPGLVAVWQAADLGGAWTDLAGGETATIGGRTQSWYAATTPQLTDRQFYRVVFTDPGSGQVLASFAGTLRSRRAEVRVEVDAPRVPTRVGEATTIEVRVATNSAGLPAPTGKITLSLGFDRYELELTDGRAVFQIPGTTPAGEYALYAQYEGDGLHGTGASPESTLVVERRGSILTAEAPIEAAVGGGATITAVLSPRDLPLDPIGGVVFLDGGQPIAFVQVVTAGGRTTATFSTSGLSVGDHYIQLVYLGDLKTAAASSGVYKITVRPSGATVVGGLSAPLAGTSPAIAPPADGPPPPETSPGDPAVASATRSVDSGDDVIFTLPTGGDFASIQWQESDDLGATWSDVPGATGAWLRFTASFGLSGRRFRARLVDGGGTAVFSPAEVLEVARRPIRVAVQTYPLRPIIGEDFAIVVQAAPSATGSAATPEGDVTLSFGTFTQTLSLVDGRAQFSIPAGAASGHRVARLTYAPATPEFEASVVDVPLTVGRRSSFFYASAPWDVMLPDATPVQALISRSESGAYATGGVMVLDGGRPIALIPLDPASGSSSYSIAKASLRLAAGVHYLQFVYLGDPKTLMFSSGVNRVEVLDASRQAAAPAAFAASASPDPARPASGVATALRAQETAAAQVASSLAPSKPRWRGAAAAFSARPRPQRASPVPPPARPRTRFVDPGTMVRARTGGWPGLP